MATHNEKLVLLPVSRVKTIMKSTPDVENVSQESIFLVAKATELFIQFLAQESLVCNSRNNELEYGNVAEIVDREPSLEFLREIIPQKITVKEYKKILRKQNKLKKISMG